MRNPILPIPIRGHTLLCLQGFRGEGYDPMFTAHMSAIHQRLNNQPALLVKVITKPDTFCHSCPNLSEEQGCRLHGDGTEAKMVSQDREVMQKLGIQSEETLSWETIVQKIGEKMKPAMLDELCGACPWLPLGYCKEGLLNLDK
ncbi:MAG: DUF1284 domain-containing protein [Nitrospirae bacterium]|nr:DUF1284 domain-containing protein [Nitrospirota bacterium]